MFPADELLEKIFSWIDQRSLCADQLVKLAEELESLRQNYSEGEAVGKSLAACVIGAGITGGAAAPVLGLSGGSSIGLDTVVSVTTKLVEDFLSSSTMKEAKKTEEKSNKLAKDIKRLFEKLKSEKEEETNTFPDPDDLDRRILTDILRAVARRSGEKINVRMINELNMSFGEGQHVIRLSHGLDPKILVSVTGVLAFFTLKSIGKKSKFLFKQGAQKLIKKISVTGMKTVLKGGGMLVGGAIGMAFVLDEAIDSWTDLIKYNNHVTEASQSLRDTAEAILKICQGLKDQFKDMKKKLEKIEEQRELEKIKCIIENPIRSSGDVETLIKFYIDYCEIKEVKQWLSEYPQMETFIGLVDLFRLMKDEIINKSNEDESRYEDFEVDIIFVAHGAITGPKIPASCLLPASNIQDVFLYSPWNCFINSDVAYGIATGLMQPHHREFICNPGRVCETPDEGHKPENLPPGWNSMKGEEEIPNIMVSTITDPEDVAWKGFIYLTETRGRPGRGRIIVPFILGGYPATIPFYIITSVMSLVLSFFDIEATVHLAACLVDGSTRQEIPREFLEKQYCYTIDNTVMTSSRAMWLITHLTHLTRPDLYRNLQAMFH